MSQPAREVVDRYAVYQKVAGIAMTQRMAGYPAPRRQHPQLHRTSDCRTYPPVGGRPRCPDESVTLDDVPELEGAGESCVELGMCRSDACFTALALPHPDGGPAGVQCQVQHLACQSF